jgi:methanogenic corrinoid protein MtbC1
MKSLVAAILDGDTAQSLTHAQNLLSSGLSAQSIVLDGLEAAMSQLDAKCTIEEFNLLEIMLAGRAVTEVMKVLYPGGMPGAGAKGKIVVATLEGDVHDLGKNILKTILFANGYGVVDCGKDCPLQKLINACTQESPKAVAISGLITPVIPQVKKVRARLLEQGLKNIKIVAGGAALKQSSSEILDVDFVAESAFDALHYLEGLGVHE